MDYPWYQTLKHNNDLQQGDFIDNCPVIIPPATLEEGILTDVDVKTMNTLILTQSCDLVNKNIDTILVCRFFTLKNFLNVLPGEQTSTPKACKKIIDNLRKGYFPAYHLLNKQEGIFNDYLVVDFKNVYGIHRSTLTELANQLETRIRLLPPYREHLSQAFARYFMRVGLPQDIIIEGY